MFKSTNIKYVCELQGCADDHGQGTQGRLCSPTSVPWAFQGKIGDFINSQAG